MAIELVRPPVHEVTCDGCGLSETVEGTPAERMKPAQYQVNVQLDVPLGEGTFSVIACSHPCLLKGFAKEIDAAHAHFRKQMLVGGTPAKPSPNGIIRGIR